MPRKAVVTGMKRILVVDDDQHIGNLLEEALRAEGYGVSRSYSGTEAQLLLEREKPDLVLLDLMLPGLSGEALLPRLSGIPVIVVSAKAGVDDKVKLLLGGAADYVTKPFVLRCSRGSRCSCAPRRARTPRCSPPAVCGSTWARMR